MPVFSSKRSGNSITHSIYPFSIKACLVSTLRLFANVELVTKVTILPFRSSKLRLKRISCHSPSAILDSGTSNLDKDVLSGKYSIAFDEDLQRGIVKIRSNN